MGLDISHDTWHGAYSAFHRWREKIADLTGYEYPKNPLEEKDDWWFSKAEKDVLDYLLHHSDCDGHITWRRCGKLAKRLKEILPLFPDGDGGGHIGNWRDKTKQFIKGCEDAYKAKEYLEFG